MPTTVAQLRTELTGDLRPLEAEVAKANALLNQFARRTFAPVAVRADVSQAERAIGQVAARVAGLTQQIQRDLRGLSRLEAVVGVRVDAEAVPAAVRAAVALAEERASVINLRAELDTRAVTEAVRATGAILARFRATVEQAPLTLPVTLAQVNLAGELRAVAANLQRAAPAIEIPVRLAAGDFSRDVAGALSRIQGIRREASSPFRLPDLPPVRVTFTPDRASLERAIGAARERGVTVPLRFERPVLPDLPPVTVAVRPVLEIGTGGIERALSASLEGVERRLPAVTVTAELATVGLLREATEARGRLVAILSRIDLPPLSLAVDLAAGNLRAEARTLAMEVARGLPPVTVTATLEADRLLAEARATVAQVARSLPAVPVRLDAGDTRQEAARIAAEASRTAPPVTLTARLDAEGLTGAFRSASARLAASARPIVVPVEARAAAERLTVPVEADLAPLRAELPPALIDIARRLQPLRIAATVDVEGLAGEEARLRTQIQALGRRLAQGEVRLPAATVPVEVDPADLPARLRAAVTAAQRTLPPVTVRPQVDARALLQVLPSLERALASLREPVIIPVRTSVTRITVPVTAEFTAGDVATEARAAITALGRTLPPLPLEARADLPSLERAATQMAARLRTLGERLTIPVTAGRSQITVPVRLDAAGLPVQLQAIANRLSASTRPVELTIAVNEAGAIAAAERIRARLAAAAQPAQIDLPTAPVEVPARLVLETSGFEEEARAFLTGLVRRLPAVTVRAGLETAPLDEGLLQARERVEAFRPTATATAIFDSRSLETGIARSLKVLDAFGDEVEDTQRKLALLRAPNLEGRLAIRFPGIPPAAIASLASAQREIERLEGSARRAQGPLSALGDALQGGALAIVGQALIQNVSRPLVQLGRGFLDTSVRVEGLQKSLALLGGSTEVAQRQFAQIQEVADRLGFRFDALTEGFQRFAASGTNPILARSLLEGLALAAAQANLGVEDVQASAIQLGQILSSGKLQGDELIAITSRIPAFGKAMRDALGTIDTEKLAKSGRSVEEMLGRVAVELLKIQPPTDATRLSLNRLQNEFVRTQDAIGKALLPIAKDIADTLLPALQQFQQMWTGLSTPVKQAALAFGAVVIAAGPLLQIFGAIAAARAIFSIQALTGAVTTLRGTLMGVPVATTAAATGLRGLALAAIAARGPIVALVGGLGVLTAGIVTNTFGMRDQINRTLDELAASFQRFIAFYGSFGQAVTVALNSGPVAALQFLQQRFETTGKNLQDQLELIDQQYTALARKRQEAEKQTPETGGDAGTRALLKQQEDLNRFIAGLGNTSSQAADKMREKFREALSDMRKELATLRAPDLLAKLRVEFPGIPEGQLRELARLTTERDREQAAIERLTRAEEERRQALERTSQSLLKSAAPLPGRLGADVRGFARGLETRAQTVGPAPAFDASGVMQQQFAIQSRAIQTLGTRFGELGCARAVSSILSGSVAALGRINDSSVAGLVDRLTGLGARRVTRAEARPGDVAVFNRGELSQANAHVGVLAEINRQIGVIHNSTRAGLRTAFDPGLQERASFFLRLPDELGRVGTQIAGIARETRTALTEVDPSRGFLQVGEVLDTLAQRYGQVRQQIALNNATTAEGRVAVELMGDTYARTHPLVKRLADELARQEEVLRQQQLEQKLRELGTEARTGMLAAAAATDAERLALETLGVSLSSLADVFQDKLRAIADTQQLRTVGQALREAQNDLAVFTAKTAEQRLALELLGQSFGDLAPAVQVSLRSLAAAQGEIAEWERLKTVSDALASLRRELAQTAASTSRDRAAFETLGESFDALMERFVSGARVRIELPDIQRATAQAAQAFVGPGPEQFGRRLRAAADDALGFTRRLSEAEGPLRAFLGTFETLQEGAAGGGLPFATELLDFGRQIAPAFAPVPRVVADLTALAAPLERFKQVVATGDDLAIRGAVGRFRVELEAVARTVGETNPAIVSLRARFDQLAGVVEIAGIREFQRDLEAARERLQGLDEALTGMGRGAIEAAGDLAILQAEQAVSSREIALTQQALQNVGQGFVAAGGDVDAFVEAQLRGDGALEQMRRDLIALQVVLQRTGGSWDAFVARVTQQANVAPTTLEAAATLAQIPALQAEVEARIRTDVQRRTGEAQEQAAQNSLQVTRSIQQEIAGVGQRIAELNAGADTQAQILARLNLSYASLTEEQQKWLRGLVQQTEELRRLEAVQQFAEGLQGVFSSTFAAIGDGFGAMVGTFAQEFDQLLIGMAQKFLASQLANLFIRGLSSAFGGGFGQILGDLAAGSSVGPGRQSGGFMQSGMIYPTGEGGRTEYFMPNKSGGLATADAIGQAVARYVGGGGPSVTVNIHGVTNTAEWQQSKHQVAADMARIMRVAESRRGV